MKAHPIICLLVLVQLARAGVPVTLNYQGRVLQNGQPFDGAGHFVFGIHEGSTLLWTNKLPVPSPLNDPASSIDSSDAKALILPNKEFLALYNATTLEDQVAQWMTQFGSQSVCTDGVSGS